MTSILHARSRIRLDPVSYENLRQQVLRRGQLAVSIVRHDVKLGGPPQTVSKSIRPRFRREPNYGLYLLPFWYPSLRIGDFVPRQMAEAAVLSSGLDKNSCSLDEGIADEYFSR